MKRIIRIMLLVIIFIAAAAFFFFILNRGTEEPVSDTTGREIPVVRMQLGDEWVNMLHGYSYVMSDVSMRDSILPMPDDGKLSLLIENGEEVSGVAYEIRTLDGETLVSEGRGTLSEKDESGKVTADVPLTDNLAQGTDHILVLQLQTGKGSDAASVYYYARLAKFTDAHVPECLKFVKKLHKITLDPTRSNELTGSMEPSAEGENDTLQKVTIHSSLDLICWADFDHELLTEPEISIKEITNSYSVYVLNYVVRHGEDMPEYYNVREYYRVRYSEKKAYLLDFERTMERIYTGNTVAGEDSINLGIRSSDVDYSFNQAGTVVCFVQAGELWSYDAAQGQMVRIFGFRDMANSDGAAFTDPQKGYDEHEIRTIRVDENGSIDFIVYGYMNTGQHAGEVGISVCHYDSVSDSVQELIFLPQLMSYQQLKENVGGLMYVSDKGMFYFSAGTDVYRIDLAQAENESFLTGVRRNFRVSTNGRYLAWTEADDGKYAAVMHITDLETEQTSDVTVGKGECLQPLGFLGTDCLYGTAKKKEAKRGARQNLFPMRSVTIIDAQDPGQEGKTYKGNKAFFSAVRISSEGSITLDRVRDNGTAYVKTEPTSIKNNELLSRAHAGVIYLDSSEKQVEIGLTTAMEISEKAEVKEAGVSARAGSIAVELPEDVFASNYYVYAKGRVLRGTSDAAAAVRLADANGGVVTDDRQRYIWNRAKMLSQNKIILQDAGGRSDEAKALNVMIAAMGASPVDTDSMLADGKSALDILTGQQGDGLILNLAGCSLDEIVYYIGRGYPAYAVREDDAPVLLYGYDSANIRIYEPADGTTSEMSLEAAAEMFEQAGNIFYVYQKQI